MNHFGQHLIVSGSLVDLVFSAIMVQMSSQLFILWAAAIVGTFSSIWFSKNCRLRAKAFVLISKALVFTNWAIKEASISNNRTIFNKLTIWLLFVSLGFDSFFLKFNKIFQSFGIFLNLIGLRLILMGYFGVFRD